MLCLLCYVSNYCCTQKEQRKVDVGRACVTAPQIGPTMHVVYPVGREAGAAGRGAGRGAGLQPGREHSVCRRLPSQPHVPVSAPLIAHQLPTSRPSIRANETSISRWDIFIFFLECNPFSFERSFDLLCKIIWAHIDFFYVALKNLKLRISWTYHMFSLF